MPRKKSPASLQASCIKVVANLLKNMNQKLENSNSNIMVYPSGHQSPFACIPDVVIQELISSLGSYTRGQHKAVHKEILKMLLCRNMEKLDLSPVRFYDQELADILYMVSEIAEGLLHLSIFAESFGMIPRDQFEQMLLSTGVGTAMMVLVGRLKNVTHLYLHNVCFDELMSAIGENCKSLQIFRAMSENVSDYGLKCLCVNLHNPENSGGRCQKLQKISLDPRAEGITIDGIKVLLQHLPEISDIEGCKIGNVLEEIHHQDPNLDRTYKIKNFMYDWRDSNYNPLLAVTIAVRTCPFITILKLLEPSDEALVQLGQLRHLVIVSVITYSSPTTFHGGVLPFLRQIGTNLNKLSLSLKKINLAVIDELCPFLKCLDCSIVEEIEENLTPRRTPFSNLEDLVFHATSLTTLTTSSIKMLLSHCLNLQYLYLSCCSCLTDTILTEILQINPLKKLKYLHFMYVESLTAAGIQLLINQESDLRRIWLFDAAGIYKAALRDIKVQVQKMNLDLRINDDLL